jgi:mono/diheme cytochrome c family protein
MSRRSLLGTAAGAALLFGLAATPARAEHSETFQTYCAVCHGDDGKGQTEKGKEKGARDFTNAKWQKSVDDERLEKSIENGKGKMPKFKGKIADDEIDKLVKEVRSFAAK